jgi:hypothetical protein
MATQVVACDLCAVYSASESRGEIGKGLYAGVAEQFTQFGTLQDNGTQVPNESNQWLDSSITQLLLGYNFNERVGVQFNLPLIYRSFSRPEGFETDRGTESGLGDALLLGHLQLFRSESQHGTFTWNLLGGVKLPTGSSARIAEELDEMEVPGAPESGIHGHDLALGSGSWDGLVGTSVYARWKRAFATASVQYAIRSRGDYDYQYANDLTWSGGPGALLWLDDRGTLSLQLNCTGEHKGTDNLAGETAVDTGITSVFLGPEVHFTWGSKLSAELGFDLPVSIDNTALQLVPDWRVRAALTWHF